MKKLFVLLLSALSAVTANAAILGAPYTPEEDARFNAIEGPVFLNQNYPAYRTDSNSVKHVAQATYDFSVQGGTAGTYDLGVSIPKNAVFVRSYTYTVTATAPTNGTAGIAFYCENTGDITPANASYPTPSVAAEGASTGAASAFKFIDTAASTCHMHAVVTGTLTAGKVTAFVEYVLHK